MKSFLLSLSILCLFTTAACNRDDTPQPVEQELITTIRLIVTDTAGTARTFDYRVQNGFGSTSPGTLEVDTVVLPANISMPYDVEVRVLNETAQPAEDLTNEIIAERDAHLFLFRVLPSNLLTQFQGGSLDGAGRPFYQRIKLATSTADTGTITVTLLHEPTYKAGETPATAGGETDAEAVFPYRITL
jgi:hypothetical protein